MGQALSNISLPKVNANWVHWFFVFYGAYIVFLSASINEFADSPVALLLFFIVSIMFLIKTRGVHWLKDRTGLWLLFGSLAIELFHYVSTGVFTIGSLKFFAMIIAIYHMVNEHGRRATDAIFSVIYKMVRITIPFYVIQFLSIDTLRAIMSPFNLGYDTENSVGGVYVFFFNLCPWQPDRNAGFMWEAGSFGAMIVFVLVYRFVYLDEMKVTKKSIFLALYSITTISTTTYIALFMCFVYLVHQKYRKNVIKLVGMLGLAAVIAVPVYNLPFMKGKIDDYMNDNLDYKSIYARKLDQKTNESIGRFAGLLIEVDRVKERPFLGYGWDDDYEMLGIGNFWSNPNGLAVLLGKFGAMGMFFLIFGIYHFLPAARAISVRDRVILTVALLLPAFSNPFQYNVVFWTLIMIGIVNRANSPKVPVAKLKLTSPQYS